MSTMLIVSPSRTSSPPLRPPFQTADGVFDVLSAHLRREQIEEVLKRVRGVSDRWQCGLLDEKTLVLRVPFDQESRGISKASFVDLLEYAEEELGVERVLAVFKKEGISLSDGFPRVLQYCGFRLLAPESLPQQLDNQNEVALCYRI